MLQRNLARYYCTTLEKSAHGVHFAYTQRCRYPCVPLSTKLWNGKGN